MRSTRFTRMLGVALELEDGDMELRHLRYSGRAPVTSGVDERVMQVVECTIPAHMTIDHWRRQDRTADCDHLHETTTRYDRQARRLDFFLFCPVCRTARLVHSVDYEPRFEPIVARVHALPRREAPQPRRRAA